MSELETNLVKKTGVVYQWPLKSHERQALGVDEVGEFISRPQDIAVNMRVAPTTLRSQKNLGKDTRLVSDLQKGLKAGEEDSHPKRWQKPREDEK